MMVGDGMGVTVISGNRSVIDGWTTFRSATFAVSGRGFIARDITFENTAGAAKHQAVALRSDSDLSVFFRCEIKGYQDTLYTHTMRQFYRECRISGTVDFIFGDATAVFQNCQILAKKGLSNQKNTITAQGRKDPNEPTGFSIQFCNISADIDLLPYTNSTYTYLGRPWKIFSRTVVMQSYMSDVIRPQGWLEWSGDQYLDTLHYGEYLNYGPGAGLANRVKWPGYHIFNTSNQANNFTVAQFIEGNLWLPSTGVRYTAGPGGCTLGQSFLSSTLTIFIDPTGWTNWFGDQGLDGLYYGEYDNYGPGSAVDSRVTWPGFHIMDAYDVYNFTVSYFITGDEWLHSTSFPYDDGI
ncbi:hypothetical protein GH714_037916 [Hevea brasiliensis]|uniref:Pectinesterase n=1 Tax=Hevea brasiliensis TaxID=3981 RepID=A0A6A6KAS6_HEVBR|nr:hypothetical protein GH714_037916 [Hevea brasiliensis]